MKFKVLNINIPLTHEGDDEDLQQYISVHTQGYLCVTTDQYEEVGVCKLEEPRMILDMDVGLGKENPYIRNAMQLEHEEKMWKIKSSLARNSYT